MRRTPKNRYARQFAGDFFIGLAVCLAVLALAILETRAARSAPLLVATASQPAQTAATSPAGATMGTLFLRATGEDGSQPLVPAARLETDVDIAVTGPIARATVTQRFRNTSGGWVEGLYAFPLPETAVVDALSMRIGTRTVKGRITPRKEARRMYQAARAAGRKARLRSQHRANMFTSAVTNVGPGEEITVRIEYQELLRRNGDTYSLRFPLVVAPRHAPKPHLHPVRLDGRAGASGPNPPVRDPADGKINRVSLQVRLDSGFPLGVVKSRTHEIAVRRTGETTALLGLSRGHVPADRNFELTWTTKHAALPQITAFHDARKDGGYVLALLAPPKIEAEPAPMPREVIFVIDTSGSMAGTSIEQAKQSLNLALERLKPGDRFNVIRFDRTFEQLFDDPASVTRESVTIATQFVSRLEARGGTEMLPALKAALAVKRKDRGTRVRQVVFLTDGAVANEAELLSALAVNRRHSRLFVIGISAAPNSFLMRRAAEIGRGSFVHISSRSQVLARMTRLFERLERPVITDLQLEWASGLRADTWPNPMPDLYSGDPILITAHLSALKGDLKITGKIAGKPWTQTVALAKAKKGSGVGKFWARQKIASLETRRYAGQSASDVDAAIEAVALEHGLVSRMTSLVAVDVTPSRPEDQPLASEDLPINLPAGWVHDSVFGTQPDQPGAHRTRAASLARPAAPSRGRNAAQAPLGKQPSAHEKAVNPPAGTSKLALKTGKFAADRSAVPGATDTSERIWTLTVMALIFGVMTALTLGLWRHLRRAVVPLRDGRRVQP